MPRNELRGLSVPNNEPRGLPETLRSLAAVARVLDRGRLVRQADALTAVMERAATTTAMNRAAQTPKTPMDAAAQNPYYQSYKDDQGQNLLTLNGTNGRAMSPYGGYTDQSNPDAYALPDRRDNENEQQYRQRLGLNPEYQQRMNYIQWAGYNQLAEFDRYFSLGPNDPRNQKADHEQQLAYFQPGAPQRNTLDTNSQAYLDTLRPPGLSGAGTTPSLSNATDQQDMMIPPYAGQDAQAGDLSQFMPPSAPAQ